MCRCCGWGWARCAICAALRSPKSWARRKASPFVDLADLLRRVPLQAKEIRHLIQCGALDGLGDSRAAMLEESTELWRAGGAQQMAFSFTSHPTAAGDGPPAPSVGAAHPGPAPHRSSAGRHRTPDASAGPLTLSLIDVPASAGRPIVTRCVRLPGWPGGRGFFVGDRQTYVVAIGAKGLRSPKPWQPLAIRGRWRVDEWGGGWLQVDGVEVLQIH